MPSVTGSSRLPGKFPNHSIEEILSLLPRQPDDFAEFYAETSVSVSSPTDKGDFSTKISYRLMDSLLVKVRFKLGIEGARVLITGDSTFIYDRIQKEVVYGQTKSVTRLLPGAILGTDIVDAALDYIQPDPALGWTLESDSTSYNLISLDGSIRYLIDPRIWRVIYVEERDANGEILEQRWFQDFRRFNEHVLPRRLQLSRPPDDTRLSMVLRKVDTDPTRLSFDLGIKDDARRILVQ